jgi:hypothetical protein
VTDYEKTRLDVALRDFTTRNFEKPSVCKNLDQLRFYIRELCLKIEEYETKFHYVPEWAYVLLTQYNQKQNSLLLQDFQKTYS